MPSTSDISVVFFRCLGCRASHQKVFTSCHQPLISLLCFSGVWGVGLASHQEVFTSCRPALISLLCFSGVWGVGLATRKCSLHAVPLGIDINSWVLRNDGVLCHNGEEKAKLSEMPQEGDIIVSRHSHLVTLFLLFW